MTKLTNNGIINLGMYKPEKRGLIMKIKKIAEKIFGNKSGTIRWLLFLYDIFVFLAVVVVLLGSYCFLGALSFRGVLYHAAVSFVCIFFFRFLFGIYTQIWRYGGIQCYIRLLFSDGCAFIVYNFVNDFRIVETFTFTLVLAFICVNCLAALAIRMIYRYFYKTGRFGGLLKFVSGGKVQIHPHADGQKIRVAIVGAGRVGVSLAEELLNNEHATYTPRCFIETNKLKIGRKIYNLPVFPEDDNTAKNLKNHEVQEIIFAVPQLSGENKKAIYEKYKDLGYKLKVYDFPMMQAAGGKRLLRDFDAEDLLFREPLDVTNDVTGEYYKDKVVLITGGGGSIGSELCRQLAKMNPKQLIILDVYENGAYEVQQELKIAMGDEVDIKVVIASICNVHSLERIFNKYRPQVVIHAAAHKHVPFMEDDCIEAVENNVFGTLNTVEVSEKYDVEKFIMVSTDKAVNPTNVMGATKRVCEMIVLNHKGNMACSATRFGNVLGSAGSVIPLFKKQIASGGPVTITDKRIIRYFMTIPEAAQLVLQSGAMAKNKELFVLDMGKPVKILDLAENMIKLSGQTDIAIVETGLRPGEKLYEELLVKTEELDKTDNELIFIERDKQLEDGEIEKKLDILRKAVENGSEENLKNVMKDVVPTYRSPEEFNS